jgi:hypothetical protein
LQLHVEDALKDAGGTVMAHLACLGNAWRLVVMLTCPPPQQPGTRRAGRCCQTWSRTGSSSRARGQPRPGGSARPSWPPSTPTTSLESSPRPLSIEDARAWQARAVHHHTHAHIHPRKPKCKYKRHTSIFRSFFLWDLANCGQRILALITEEKKQEDGEYVLVPSW